MDFFSIIETYMVNLMRYFPLHGSLKPSMISSDDYQEYQDDVTRMSGV